MTRSALAAVAAPRATTRRADLWRVYETVSGGRASTRRELSQLLGVRSSSISDLVATLLEEGLLVETVVGSRGRGRPARMLVQNGQRFGAIVLQVMSRSIEGHAVNLARQTVASARVEPTPDSGNGVLEAALRDLVARLRPRLARDCELCGIACALPGLLDAGRDEWCFSSRWPKMRGLDLKAALAGHEVPVLTIRHLDAELMSRLDEAAATLDRRKATLLLHWGYGIGAAYAVNGTIVSGAKGRFCEIGHWRLGGDRGRPCACGNLDCLETVASLWALAPKLRERWPDLPVDEERLAAIAHELPLVEHPAMAEAILAMERVIANLCRLLFPERIVLTGPFIANPVIFERLRGVLAGPEASTFFDPPMVLQGLHHRLHETRGALQPLFAQAVAAAIG